MGLLLEHALDILKVVELSLLPLVEEPELYFGSLDTPIVLIPKHPFLIVLKFFNNCNFLDYNSLFFTYMSRTCNSYLYNHGDYFVLFIFVGGSLY